MLTKDFDLEIKGLTEEGSFQGYGSVFGNVDSYGEIVMPGAFSKSLAAYAKAGNSPLMLWQHNSHEPIGVWEDMKEDARGLKATGRLILETQKGKEVHALMKNKAVGGLSIGYRVNKESKDDKGNILLEEIKLLEISVVSFAANEKARVTAVKSDERLANFARKLRDGEPMPIQEFEDILREAGVPKSMATQIASVGYAKAIRREADGDASQAKMAELLEQVRTIRANIYKG